MLTITQTDTDTFCFEAYVSGSAGTPANIDKIVVADNLGGTVRVSVLQNPGNSPATTRGAASVRIIDLSEADTGEVVSLDLSVNLGRIFPTDGYVDVDAITGTATSTSSAHGTFTIGNLSGSLTAGGIAGSTANIDVLQAMSGTMQLSRSDGTIRLHDDLSGRIFLTGTLVGRIQIDGDVIAGNTDARLRVNGGVNHSGTSPAAILIKGSLTGTGDVPAIYSGGNRSQHDRH